jgi:hypothetical protein
MPCDAPVMTATFCSVLMFVSFILSCDAVVSQAAALARAE